MKLTSIILTACLLAVPMAGPMGCKKASPTNPATLAPGYINSQDQTMGQTLKAIHNFIDSFRQQIAAGYAASTTEKTAFNALIATTNAADSTYLAFHSGQATQTAAQSAITQAYLQQQTLAASVNGGK